MDTPPAGNVLGVICEYNPFHNGHALHLRLAREASGAGYVVCAMSGGWVQRGEPATVNKWTRAAMALAGGADLVLELPAAWAVRSAGDFAYGAVSLLHRLGVCTHLGFGSEVPLERLYDAARRTEDAQAIRAALARGESYPRALSDGGILALPNATLGVEYLRALARCDAPLQPVAIHREAAHHALALGPLSSATAIRAATERGESVAVAMPPAAHALYEDALSRQGGPAHWERLAPLALHALRKADPADVASRYGVREGLENRLLREAKRAETMVALFDAVKCKRYTHARIRRAVAHLLLNIPAEALSLLPGYARVLGFRREAAPLLTAIAQRSSLPLVTKLPKAIEDPLLVQDVQAQDLWALACPKAQSAQLDYGHAIVVPP